ncbi:peroxisomal targeting signal 1 receptor [Schizophyllum commune]
MALPMLMNNAECGPSNALQELSKRFNTDRGLSQDYIGSGTRAGPSAFRPPSAAQDQDAARFFAQKSPAPLAVDTAFNMAPLAESLPQHHFAHTPQRQSHAPQMQGSSSAAWASEFMLDQPMVASPMVSSPVQVASPQAPMSAQVLSSSHTASGVLPMQRAATWGPAPYQAFGANGPLMQAQAQGPMQSAHSVDHSSKWETAFAAQETLIMPAPQDAQEATANQAQRPVGDDELSRMAGMVLDSVQHEGNEKFKKSQFMSLMRQLRDHEVVVEGDDMIPAEQATQQPSVDVKGKGRAVPVGGLPAAGSQIHAPGSQIQATGFRQLAQENLRQIHDATVAEAEGVDAQMDDNDAYFARENADYIKYWKDQGEAAEAARNQRAQETNSQWAALQDSWDQFEATATGIKPVPQYQFQPNNPYLLGESSRHHRMHAQTAYESILELEAAVQRDPTNAAAWFELGVKQQESEREQKALHALQRSVALDSTYMPAWLALAVSFTNDNHRAGTYNAIREWLNRNDKLAPLVAQYRAGHPEVSEEMSTARQYTDLVECLMHVIRSDASGEIDADVQIALAVMLNTNEEYVKACDCFRTALAVRPEDWLLYNRVGATLANSNRPQEALDYYYRALELNPLYIRARYNLGISCINLFRYKEAAGHILDALLLQDSEGVTDPAGSGEGRGVTSGALWGSLKTACLHMQRLDLATLCDRQDLEGFRSHFDA